MGARRFRLLSEVAPLLAVMWTVNQQLAYSDGVIKAISASTRACSACERSQASAQ